jgi:hypothetical protein
MAAFPNSKIARPAAQSWGPLAGQYAALAVSALDLSTIWPQSLPSGHFEQRRVEVNRYDDATVGAGPYPGAGLVRDGGSACLSHAAGSLVGIVQGRSTHVDSDQATPTRITGYL